jgi:hypothetical protein
VATMFLWQGRQDLNPQPPVLETGALPVELLPCAAFILTDATIIVKILDVNLLQRGNLYNKISVYKTL